jgi:hypothetical protein
MEAGSDQAAEDDLSRRRSEQFERTGNQGGDATNQDQGVNPRFISFESGESSGNRHHFPDFIVGRLY